MPGSFRTFNNSYCTSLFPSIGSIDLHTIRGREFVMDGLQRESFFVILNEFTEKVDPLTFSSCLYKCGFVNKHFCDDIRQKFARGQRRRDVAEYLASKLPAMVTFNNVVRCLDKCGYHQLASKLLVSLFKSRAGVNTQGPNRSDSRSKIQVFSKGLKKMVHDAQFDNPRRALRNLASRYQADLDVESDVVQRQKLADKYVAVLGVEVDAHYDSLTFKSELSQDEMLLRMLEAIPFTSNSLVSEIVYCSRKANLEAFRGNMEESENMLVRARASSTSVNSCLEIVNMLYIEVYVKLWQYEHIESPDILESIMMWGRIGIEALNEQPSETRIFWRRMFMIRMVFGLLGIGNRANIIPGRAISESQLGEARRLLATIDAEWDGIETRREMFYCVARARFSELINLLEDAILYLERAIRLAHHGRFLEKVPFLEEFLTTLNCKLNDTIGSSEDSIKRFRNVDVSDNQLMQTLYERVNTHFNTKDTNAQEQTKEEMDTEKYQNTATTQSFERLTNDFPGISYRDIEEANEFTVVKTAYKLSSNNKICDAANDGDDTNVKTVRISLPLDPTLDRAADTLSTGTKVKLLHLEDDLEPGSSDISKGNIKNPVNDSKVDTKDAAIMDEETGGLGSIALFEERTEPEGASRQSTIKCDSTLLDLQTDMKIGAIDEIVDSIDDDDLFGDG